MASDAATKQELDWLRSEVKRLVDHQQLLKQRDLAFQRTLDAYSQHPALPPQTAHRFDGLSLVIAYYNIPQQLERTLLTCSPEYQDAPSDGLEVIIADNGSTTPLPADLIERF
ncbi:MAG: hypothetical protein AAF986_02290, partial [Pseudomonadota bacterium]